MIKMLTNLIVGFCNTYLGQYLENLDADQLSFSLLQGKAELQNLSIKKTAFEKHDLPFEVHAGFVGKICIDIPLTQISSQPWVISLEQLYLVAGPKKTSEEHMEKGEQMESLQCKRAALDLMEAEWKSKLGFLGLVSLLYNSTFSSWLRHGTSIATNTVQNIELKIKNIHLRFEDDGISCPGKIIACGIHLKSFTAQTCDEHWKTSKFVSHSQMIMYKLLELDGLAVYWDTATTVFADLPLIDLCKNMKRCSIQQDSFILAPTHGCAHLKRNCVATPLQSLNHPRIACDFVLDQFDIEFRDTQYYQCCKTLEILSRVGRRKFNPGRQWKYTVERIIAEIQERRRVENWPFVIQRIRDILLYVRSYKEHLMNFPAAAEFELERERIESEFELEELMTLRSIAMRQIPKSKNIFQRWYGDFSTWWYANDNWKQLASNESIMEKTAEHEILDVLEKARKDNLVREEDMLPIQFSFTLKQGCLRLSSCYNGTKTYQPADVLVELELSETVVEVWKSHPRMGWIKLHVRVGNITLCDRKTTFFRSYANPGDATPLFDFVYEKQPPDRKWNHCLKITALPTNFVYKHTVFCKIRQCFPLPKKERSLLGQRVRKEVRYRFKHVKRNAKKIFKIAAVKLSNNESWDLKINVAAPRIQIAESPFSPVPITLDLGHISVNPTIICALADLASLNIGNTVDKL